MRLKLEHFWLCGDCCQSFDFRVFSDRPAVAIHCGIYSQRFVRTEQATSPGGKEPVTQYISVTTAITEDQQEDSDPLLSGPEKPALQDGLWGYLPIK
jgi:hypothetical protein